MNAREAILAAVRRANPPSPIPADASPPIYRRHGAMTPQAREARFLERLADYGVGVACVADDDAVAAIIAERLAAAGVAHAAIPAGFPPAWRPEELTLVAAEALDPAGLDATPAAVTGCALAIAETGSLLLDGGPAQGPRALTLLSDHHVCVATAAQLVETVPEALQRVAAMGGAGRPLTLISGPSATADIEFERVVGVHGPRRLDVVFVRASRFGGG